MNTSWNWIRADVLMSVHEEQLLEHGGPGGVRDQGLLESALARPQQLAAYADPDAAALAASLTWGLAKNHPFVDGNKRTAFVAMELFLLCNGYVLTASDPQCVLTMLDVAAGEMGEEALAKWLRQHIHPR